MALSEHDARERLNTINLYFKQNVAPISCYIKCGGIHIINSDAYYDIDTDQERDEAWANYYDPNAINIHYVHGGHGRNFVLSDGRTVDWAGIGGFLTKNLMVRTAITTNYDDVLPHELGHCLGLEHTHNVAVQTPTAYGRTNNWLVAQPIDCCDCGSAFLKLKNIYPVSLDAPNTVSGGTSTIYNARCFDCTYPYWTLPYGFTLLTGQNTGFITFKVDQYAQCGNLWVTERNSQGCGSDAGKFVTVQGRCGNDCGGVSTELTAPPVTLHIDPSKKLLNAESLIADDLSFSILRIVDGFEVAKNTLQAKEIKTFDLSFLPPGGYVINIPTPGGCNYAYRFVTIN